MAPNVTPLPIPQTPATPSRPDAAGYEFSAAYDRFLAAMGELRESGALSPDLTAAVGSGRILEAVQP
jgi:hypothetical protein